MAQRFRQRLSITGNGSTLLGKGSISLSKSFTIYANIDDHFIDKIIQRNVPTFNFYYLILTISSRHSSHPFAPSLVDFQTYPAITSTNSINQSKQFFRLQYFQIPVKISAFLCRCVPGSSAQHQHNDSSFFRCQGRHVGSVRFDGLNNTDVTTVYVQLYWPINPVRGSVQRINLVYTRAHRTTDTTQLFTFCVQYRIEVFSI